MSAGDGAASRSPYIVSDLKRARRGGGSGMNGGRRHQPPGANRVNSIRAVVHSRGRAARALAEVNTILTENTTPMPEA